MARLDGETLNSVFDELANWKEQLKHAEIDKIIPEKSHHDGSYDFPNIQESLRQSQETKTAEIGALLVKDGLITCLHKACADVVSVVR